MSTWDELVNAEGPHQPRWRARILAACLLTLSCSAPLGPGVDANGVRYGADVSLSGLKQDSVDVRVWVHNNTAAPKTVEMWICPNVNTKVAVLDAAQTTRWTSSAWDVAKHGSFAGACVAVAAMVSLSAYETAYPDYARLRVQIADIRGDSLPPGDYIIKIDALKQKQIATAKFTFK